MTQFYFSGGPVGREIAVEVGHALRRIRKQRGLRLRDVRDRSTTFTPTAVAGYERAERAISLQKFFELCAVYDVAPERVLADAIREAEHRPPIILDLSKIEMLDDEEGVLVRAFLDRVQTRRGQPRGQRVALRVGDLEVLATAVDRSPDELLDLVGVVTSDR